MIRANRPGDCDNVVEIGHIFGQNGVRREFHSKSSKTALWWSAAKHFLKTTIPRLLTIFCKLVIVSLVMGLNKNFKVRVPNCRFDESNRRTRWIRRLKGVWEYFAHWSSFLVLTCIREIFTVRASNRRSDDKQEKQAKKDYYEASDSVLQTGFLVGS